MENPAYVTSFLAHCSNVSSVKVWYATTQFLHFVLGKESREYGCGEVRHMFSGKLRECGVSMRSIDVYPYSGDVGLELFKEYLPSTSGMTLRPHGHEYFFEGLPMPKFPSFEKLDSLHLDCINLGWMAYNGRNFDKFSAEQTELPPTLTTLEWQNRNSLELRKFIPKLERLDRLEYLLIGHADFSGRDFNDLVKWMRRMPRLQYLVGVGYI